MRLTERIIYTKCELFISHQVSYSLVPFWASSFVVLMVAVNGNVVIPVLAVRGDCIRWSFVWLVKAPGCFGKQPLSDTSIIKPYVFVGCESFHLWTNLVKPFTCQTLDPRQWIFNYKLSRGENPHGENNKKFYFSFPAFCTDVAASQKKQNKTKNSPTIFTFSTGKRQKTFLVYLNSTVCRI